MAAERALPGAEAEEIVRLARDFSQGELAPLAAAAEAGRHFRARSSGGSGLPYEV